MALNLKKAVVNTVAVPSRIRGSASATDRTQMYRDFFALIDMAKQALAEGNPNGASIDVEGESECNAVYSAMQAMWDAHPMARACLWTTGTKMDGKKVVGFRLNAAARPTESGKARYQKQLAKREQGIKTDSGDFAPVDPGVTVRRPGLVAPDADESEDTEDSAVG